MVSHPNPPTIVNSIAEGEDMMRAWLLQPSHLNPSTAWCILMQDGDKVVFHPRERQPCYGEMRVYTKGEYRPGDLHWPFPNGTPLKLGVYWNWAGGDAKFFEALVSKDRNPYRDIVKSAELIRDDKHKVMGVIIHDLKVNADTLVGMFLHARNGNRKTTGDQPFDTELLHKQLQGTGCYSVYGIDPKLWFTATPKVPDKHLFSDRAAYRRTIIETIWGDYTVHNTYSKKFKGLSVAELEKATAEFRT